MLGNAFDHIQDVSDVIGTGIKGFDLSAGQADLLRKLRHRLNGLLHHFTTIVSLFAGTTGVLGRIRGVTRDFLGGSAQLVDGCGHAVGTRALFVRTDDRRIG